MNDRGAVRFEIFIQPCFEHLQLRRNGDNRFLIAQQRPPSDLRFSSLYRLGP